jgi:hypothetical protein
VGAPRVVGLANHVAHEAVAENIAAALTGIDTRSAVAVREPRAGAEPQREMTGVREEFPSRLAHWWAEVLAYDVLPVAAMSSVGCALAALIFLSIMASSVISSEASWRRVRPTMSGGRPVLSRYRACVADKDFLAPPGTRPSSSLCSRPIVSVLARVQHVTAVDQQPQRDCGVVGDHGSQARRAEPDDRDPVWVDGVGLAAPSGGEHPRSG